ncbi:MAG TPA: type I restriction-modification enzyme R subunit C-terminal domain-containing protein, partial [Pseudomonadota bacterium]|nr:type I restriction-modification enzyme R subunit C-terminal domain-containing protein [Pseudomonadota bacterium]
GRVTEVDARSDVYALGVTLYHAIPGRPPFASREPSALFRLIVTQRPKELTREDLRKLKLLLDEAGFSEKSVQTAWREQKNEDIAATIVGYIRQLALGSPLLPYAERVDRAVQRLRKAHKFTDPQSKWLDRIAKQVKIETVVDKAALDTGQFKADGGFARLNRVFDGKLEAVLDELAEQVWNDAA